jgi:hypothetical protein
MVGSMAKGICGNLIGTLNGSWSVGMKDDMRIMIKMAGASVMYS